MTFFLGLDLGQAADPTALAILEWHELPSEEKTETWAIIGPSVSGRPALRQIEIPSSEPGLPAFACGHLERLRLGTPYPTVADRVIALLETEPLKGRTQLVVDATGVGRPVVDMLRHRGLQPVAVTITGGDSVTFDNGWRVPKRDLVGVVQVLLQTERLEFSSDIPMVPHLVRNCSPSG